MEDSIAGINLVRRQAENDSSRRPFHSRGAWARASRRDMRRAERRNYEGRTG
jgi:hypothetical protein